MGDFPVFIRTNTYPKIPERYRLPSAPDASQVLPSYHQQHQQRSLSVHGQLPTTPVSSHSSKPSTRSSSTSSSSTSTQSTTIERKDKNQEEEVIYF